jgi:hypothetical protein
MKKNFILFLLIFVTGNTVFAKIWRVNNTGVATDFTTPQAAVNAAGVVDGDTIHIEPSGTGYGNITLTKRLIIIGNGYFLGTSGSNSNPDLQANPAASAIGDLYVSSGGSNSVIMGLTVNTAYIGYLSSVNNLLFRRNRVITSVYFYTAGSTNVQVMQCYIDGSVAQSGTHTNVLIANNIIIQGSIFDADDNGTFQNNIMHATGAAYSSSFQNFTLRSNILVAGSISSLTNCIVEFNLSYSTQFGTANGNQQNIVMANVFNGYPTIGTNSYDGRFTLKAGSPAIAAGYGSVDCGAYGNVPAYIKSGMPDVPSIYKLSVPPIVTNNVLSVIVSTKINQ